MQIPPIDRSPIWRPQSSDLYSTGASGAVPVRPIHNPNPVESMDRLGEGAVVKTPEKPSDPDTQNRDWTVVKNETKAKEPPEPPKDPPLYKVLIEHLHAIWRASGSAIEAAQEVNKNTLQERLSPQAQNEPLVYADPKVKKTGGL